ncbi:MAG: DNA repair protein RadC [Firmicutes bacterium]|nr:DNA repair protein RadC [Bacillota bacterium]
MAIEKMPSQERPRERLLSEGVSTLSNVELIAILLHTGTKERTALELAGDVLSADRRGILFLGECTPEELQQIKGVGKAKACQLMAAVELGKRAAKTKKEIRPKITSASEIAGIFMEDMRYYRKEHFNVLMVNAKGEVIQNENIAVGDLCSAVVHPREVFSPAVRRSAAAVILVHNHPSGDPEPSKEDIVTTSRLSEAGKILGINVLDHIIIGDGIFVSLRREGLF